MCDLGESIDSSVCHTINMTIPSICQLPDSFVCHTVNWVLRTSPNPLLSQWYSTNDRMLRYRRLPVDLFTDTLEAGIVSKRGEKCAQVYAHRNTWCKAYPMAKKCDAHETLSLLFAQEGVPSTLAMDGAREQGYG